MTYVIILIAAVVYGLYWRQMQRLRQERERKAVDMNRWLDARRIDPVPDVRITDAEYAELAKAYRKYEED